MIELGETVIQIISFIIGFKIGYKFMKDVVDNL